VAAQVEQAKSETGFFVLMRENLNLEANSRATRCGKLELEIP
jgi:hypothetical protein